MAPTEKIHTTMAAISQLLPAKAVTRTMSTGALVGLIIAFIIAFALVAVFRCRTTQRRSASTHISVCHELADIKIKQRASKRSVEVQEVQEVSKVILHKKSLAPSRDVGFSNHGSMQVKGIRRDDFEVQEVQEVSRNFLHKKASVPSRDVGFSNHGSMQVKGIRREDFEVQDVQEVSKIVLHKKSSVPSRDVGRSNHGSMQVKGVRRQDEWDLELGIEKD